MRKALIISAILQSPLLACADDRVGDGERLAESLILDEVLTWEIEDPARFQGGAILDPRTVVAWTAEGDLWLFRGEHRPSQIVGAPLAVVVSTTSDVSALVAALGRGRQTEQPGLRFLFGPNCMEINPGECDAEPPYPGGAYPWQWQCVAHSEMECWGQNLVAMSGQVVLPRTEGGASPLEYANVSFDAEAEVYRRICDASIVVAWGFPHTGSAAHLAASRSRRIVLS